MNRRKKILIGCAAALTTIVGIGVIHHYRVKGAVERYKANLRAQGELLDWDQIVPPPLRSEENSASLLTQLSAQLPQTGVLATNNPHGIVMVTSGKAMSGWAQPWVGGLGYGGSNSWTEALADYESQRDLLAEFQALVAQPAVDYNLDYSQGARVPLTLLASTKRCGQRLGAASACELRLKNAQQALLHVRTMVALAKGSEHEPLLISQLVRIAVGAIARVSTWDLLQTKGLDDSGLEALQQDWLELEFLPSMEPTLLMERSVSLTTIELMRKSHNEFNQLTSWTGGPFAGKGGTIATSGNLFNRSWELAKEWLSRSKTGIAEGAWRTSWSYTDELTMLQGYQAYLEVIRLSAADHFASNAMQLELRLKQAGRIPEDSGSFSFFGLGDAAAIRSMFSDGVSVNEKYFIKALKAEANARMTAVAISLERHHQRFGCYPTSLAQLTPDLISVVPLDPIDGEPMRYHSIADGGYLLYSIGDDLKDDGGNPQRAEREDNRPAMWWGLGRDWVWPQPASTEEVTTYWETEIEENFDHITGQLVPEPSYLMNTNTGLPVFDPETWEFVVDPSSTNKPDVDTAPLSEEQWRDFVRRLARQSTGQYFSTLTNAGSSTESSLE